MVRISKVYIVDSTNEGYFRPFMYVKFYRIMWYICDQLYMSVIGPYNCVVIMVKTVQP